MNILYNHPDGYQISFDARTGTLYINDGENSIDLPIGPVGLASLGQKLIELSKKATA
jgi:hypothetical protein